MDWIMAKEIRLKLRRVHIYFVFGLFVLIFDLTDSQSQSLVNLFRCCPSGFNFENNICTERNASLSNGNSSSSLDYFKVPTQLTMSAYGDEFGVLNFSLNSPTESRQCTNGNFSLNISLQNLAENRINFTVEGYLKFGKDYFAPNEYCISSETESIVSFVICNATCNDINPCIKRCCEFGEVWDLAGLSPGGNGNLLCRPSGKKQWHPVLYDDPYTLTDQSQAVKILPHFNSDHPRNGWCDPKKSVVLPLTDKYKSDTRILFRVLKDGSVVQKLRAMTWSIIPQNFTCIDGAQNFPGHFDQKLPGFYTGDPSDTLILDCRQKTAEQVTISNLYRIAMIIACVFLLLTVIVYVLLWEKQNVHGWSLLGYVTSLFFMYVFLCLMHFAKELHFTLGSTTTGAGTLCLIIGVSIHFFFLCSFCWLTVINFDLWSTFRALKPTAGKSKGLKKFIFYLIFALGVPIVIVSVGLGLDFTYRDDIESDVIVPLYGRTRCYMEQHKPMLAYVYGPIGVLITLNMIFFVVTIYSMYQIQMSTKFASQSSSKVNKHNQSAKLFIKLFIVMGVSWISEVISWAVSEEGKYIGWYFVLFDLINIFQAIMIFIIFVCKKETFVALQQKYPRFKAFVALITRKPEGNNLSSTKSTRTELSFTDSSGGKIEMSTNPQQSRAQPSTSHIGISSNT